MVAMLWIGVGRCIDRSGRRSVRMLLAVDEMPAQNGDSLEGGSIGMGDMVRDGVGRCIDRNDGGRRRFELVRGRGCSSRGAGRKLR